MAFDIEMIKRVYSEMPARQKAGRPLTLTEKILFGEIKSNNEYFKMIK